jgi:hypothetical protein
VILGGGKPAEIDEVGDQALGQLWPDGGKFKLGCDPDPALNGTNTTDGAEEPKTDRLVVPLLGEVINRSLEGAGC